MLHWSALEDTRMLRRATCAKLQCICCQTSDKPRHGQDGLPLDKDIQTLDSQLPKYEFHHAAKSTGGNCSENHRVLALYCSGHRHTVVLLERCWHQHIVLLQRCWHQHLSRSTTVWYCKVYDLFSATRKQSSRRTRDGLEIDSRPTGAMRCACCRRAARE